MIYRALHHPKDVRHFGGIGTLVKIVVLIDKYLLEDFVSFYWEVPGSKCAMMESIQCRIHLNNELVNHK